MTGPRAALDHAGEPLALEDTRWFHVPRPRGRSMQDLRMGDHDERGEAVATWLGEGGGRFRAEVRVCTSGRWGGVWLGLSGVGGSAADASRHADEAQVVLVEAIRDFGWPARLAPAPPLPGPFVSFVSDPRAPMRSATDLSGTLQSLARIARPRSPLVLRLAYDLSGTLPDLFRDAARLCELAAQRHAAEPQGPFVRPTPGYLRAARRAVEKSLDLRVSVSVHARELPGALPLRMLAATLGRDARTCLGTTDAPTPLPASFRVLADTLSLLAGWPPKLADEGPAQDDMPF